MSCKRNCLQDRVLLTQPWNSFAAGSQLRHELSDKKAGWETKTHRDNVVPGLQVNLVCKRTPTINVVSLQKSQGARYRITLWLPAQSFIQRHHQPPSNRCVVCYKYTFSMMRRSQYVATQYLWTGPRAHDRKEWIEMQGRERARAKVSRCRRFKFTLKSFELLTD